MLRTGIEQRGRGGDIEVGPWAGRKTGRGGGRGEVVARGGVGRGGGGRGGGGAGGGGGGGAGGAAPVPVLHHFLTDFLPPPHYNWLGPLPNHPSLYLARPSKKFI